MELRPGYQQTEVGVIPKDWLPKPIRKFSAFVTKGATPTTYGFGWEDDGVVFLRSECVSDKGLDLAQSMFISREAHAALARGEVRSGDILMTITGNVGRVVQLASDFGYANINQHIARIRVNDPDVSPGFVYHFLCQPRIRAHYASITTGQAYPQISLQQVRETLVSLPRPPEQRAIAGALGDVDALIGGLDQLMAKKRDLKKAAIQQLLTGRTSLPGFGKGRSCRVAGLGQVPADWTLTPLRSISTMNGRIGWQGLKQEEFTSMGTDPFLITGMNFENGEIRWNEVYHIPEKRYEEAKPIQLRSGDILMTKDGTIGKLLFVETIPFPGKASLNSHLLVFRPRNKSYVPKFLFYLTFRTSRG